MKYGQKEILINAASGSPEPAWKLFLSAAIVVEFKQNIKAILKIIIINEPGVGWEPPGGGISFPQISEGKPGSYLLHQTENPALAAPPNTTNNHKHFSASHPALSSTFQGGQT